MFADSCWLVLKLGRRELHNTPPTKPTVSARMAVNTIRNFVILLSSNSSVTGILSRSAAIGGERSSPKRGEGIGPPAPVDGLICAAVALVRVTLIGLVPRADETNHSS
jgi:hypothetical protein